MADIFQIDGTYTTKPTVGNPSAFPSLVAPLAESLQLGNKSVQSFELDADAPENVQFPDGFVCNVLVVKATGGKVRVRITSSDGATQAVPVDGLFILISESVGLTAIDLTRVSGVLTNVEVFMGEVAT
jgi:hypothetical protein